MMSNIMSLQPPDDSDPEVTITVTIAQLNALIVKGDLSFTGAVWLCPSLALRLLHTPAQSETDFAHEAAQVHGAAARLWEQYRLKHGIPERPCVLGSSASLLVRAVNYLKQFALLQSKTNPPETSCILLQTSADSKS